MAAEPKLVYVRRDADGRVISLSREVTAEHREACAEHHPEVQAFARALLDRNDVFLESDLALIRVIEDLIDVLIHKEVLRLTDLPDSVQSKLISRRGLRGSLKSLSLLGDDQETF